MNQESGDSNAVETPQTDHEVVTQSTPDDPAPADETQAVETDSDNDQSDEASKPKRRGGFQKKIEKQAAEIEFWKQQALQSVSQPQREPDNATAKEPVQSDYQTFDDYNKALSRYEARQAAKEAFEERDRLSKEADFQRERESKVKSYNTQAEEARKVYADFDEVMAEYDDVPVSPVIHAALLDSDMGPEVAYYLAKNPEEFDKLNHPNMGLVTANRIVGRIEAKIEAGKNSGEKAAVKTTKAPPPITPVKAKATSGNTPEAAAERGDYEAYRKARGL